METTRMVTVARNGNYIIKKTEQGGVILIYNQKMYLLNDVALQKLSMSALKN